MKAERFTSVHQEERRALKSTSEVDVRLKPGDGAPAIPLKAAQWCTKPKCLDFPATKNTRIVHVVRPHRECALAPG